MELLKAELKRLEDVKVIIDNDLLELESLKKHLSKKVYESNLEYTKAMQEKNNLNLAIINAKINDY